MYVICILHSMARCTTGTLALQLLCSFPIIFNIWKFNLFIIILPFDLHDQQLVCLCVCHTHAVCVSGQQHLKCMSQAAHFSPSIILHFHICTLPKLNFFPLFSVTFCAQVYNLLSSLSLSQFSWLPNLNRPICLTQLQLRLLNLLFPLEQSFCMIISSSSPPPPLPSPPTTTFSTVNFCCCCSTLLCCLIKNSISIVNL